MAHGYPLLLLLGLAGWPAEDPQLPAEELAQAERMPNDPRYAPGERCEGQLELYSFTPACTPNINLKAQQLGSGTHVDRAWLWTTGRPNVVIALLDEGVNWSDRELINRYRLNAGELPTPRTSTQTVELIHDINKDGLFNVQDFSSVTGTHAVTLETVIDVRLRARADRGDANQNGVLDPQDLIMIFADGQDDDQNGRIDDICGWDFVANDNDPAGPMTTGTSTLATAAVAEANNKIGGAGACPKCAALPLRTGVNGYASYLAITQALRFAVRTRVQIAATQLTALGFSSALDEAVDGALEAGIVIVASAGTGVGGQGSRARAISWDPDKALIVGELMHDGPKAEATTALVKSTCAGFGAQLSLAAPSRGICNGRATGVAAGAVGLVISASKGIIEKNVPPLERPPSARALMQLMMSTADPVLTDGETNGETGRGRLNARRAIDAVLQRRVPIGVRLTEPEWFSVIDPTSPGGLSVRGEVEAPNINATWRLEFAPGLRPDATDFTTIESGTLPGDEAVIGTLRPTALFPDPTAVPTHPVQFALTIRLSVDARVGSEVITSETDRVIFVHRDLELLPAFPINLGAPIVSGPRIADLDGDGATEMLIASTDGRVHIIDATGRSKEGWPISLGAPILTTPALSTSPTLIAIVTEGALWLLDENGPLPGTPISLPVNQANPLGLPQSPALADMDGDGLEEVILVGPNEQTGESGQLFVFRQNGQSMAGFPVLLSELAGTPSIGDIDLDGRPDIVVQSHERLFIFGADARPLPGWPITLDPGQAQVTPYLPSPALANIAGDERLEIITSGFGRPVAVYDQAGTKIQTVAQDRASISDIDPEGPDFLSGGGHPAVGSLGLDGRPQIVQSVLAGLDAATESGVDARLGVWNAAGSGDAAWALGFPRALSALATLGPAIADIDGDRRAEILIGDGNYRIWALGPTGGAPKLWPKLTGGAMTAPPAVGDLDGDRALDVVAATENGAVFVWRTSGSADAAPLWVGFHHDNRSTGNLETPTLTRVAKEETGCGCKTKKPPAPSGLLWFVALALLQLQSRRVRRSPKAIQRTSARGLDK